jgi:hypothetical protein
MRWGVEYEQNDAGTIGLILFSAINLTAAKEYVDDMCLKYGFAHVSNLKQITEDANVSELRRLFPGYLPDKRSKHQFRTSFDAIDG